MSRGDWLPGGWNTPTWWVRWANWSPQNLVEFELDEAYVIRTGFIAHWNDDSRQATCSICSKVVISMGDEFWPHYKEYHPDIVSTVALAKLGAENE